MAEIYCDNRSCRYRLTTHFGPGTPCNKDYAIKLDAKGKCTSFKKDTPANIRAMKQGKMRVEPPAKD